MSDAESPAPIDEGPAPRRGRLSGRVAYVAFWSLVSIALSVVVSWLPGIRDDSIATNLGIVSDDVHLWAAVFTAIVVSPIVETVLMAVPVVWLRHHGVRDGLLVAVAASLPSLTHQAFGSNALAVLPAFLVFAHVYVTRSRGPAPDGFLLAALVHAVGNLVPAAALILYRYLPSS